MSVKIFKFLYRWIEAFVEPRRLISSLEFFRFWSHFFKLRSQGVPLKILDTYPCLADRLWATPFDPHYFYQAIWLSRKIAESGVRKHVDIGSQIYLIAAISAFVECEFIDYRPLEVHVSHLKSKPGDLTSLECASNSIPSLSCLHVIEHVGLGRYGDPLDPYGSIKAAKELVRVLKSDGKLYISTPIGHERIEFNAHRIFSTAMVLDMFQGLDLCSFSFVDDERFFHADCEPSKAENLFYGCGMFEFVKP